MKFGLNQNGTTLVELLQGIAISGMLMAALWGLFNLSIKAWNTNSRIAEVQQTACFAVDAIVKDAQYATRIVVKNQQEVILTKLDGTTLRYFLDEAKQEKILRCESAAGKQPVTGNNNYMKVTIQKLAFSILARNSTGEAKTLGIDIVVQDGQNANYSYQLTTAVTANNVVP